MALKYVIFLIAVTCLMKYTNASSERLQPKQPAGFNITVSATIFDCWNTMRDINSCGNEVIGFFARGSIDHIGKPCQKAIRLITRKCWPPLLTALGLEPEVCTIVKELCGPSAGAPAATTPLMLSPVPQVKTNNAPPAKKKPKA